MDAEKLKLHLASGRLYQVIKPGHYRPCGGVDFSNMSSISVISHDPGGSGGREHVGL